MKTKTLPARKATPSERAALRQCPNFSASGSIRGMRRRFYGDAPLIRCGSFIYNVAGMPAQHIYNRLP